MPVQRGDAAIASHPGPAIAPGREARRRMMLRMPLLALGAAALIGGFWGGLWRLGWALPQGSALAALHGPLLVSGLFGTLISLERAVALGRHWPYAAPALSALGALALLSGAPASVGAAAFVLAAAILAAVSLVITARQPALFTGALLFGALAWLAGNGLWLLGGTVADLVGWWLAFLVLTIAGERLELSRVMPRKRGSAALFLVAAGLLAAGAQQGMATESGAVLFGLGALVMALWLLLHDIARRTVRRVGQTRFMAVCMLAGHAWLGTAGALLIAFPANATAFGYDAALHAVAIGFVLSMVFGHALVILPAVAGLRLAYRPWLYAPFGLLHASLALRIVGDLAEWHAGRQWGGLGTVVALAGFALSLALARKADAAPAPRREGAAAAG